MTVAFAVLFGFIADRAFGDPVYSFHPARLMGRAVVFGERRLRREYHSAVVTFISGMVLSITLVVFWFIIPFVVLKILYRINLVLGIAAEAVFCYQIVAAKSLRDESMKVRDALLRNDFPLARKYLSYIVGRDTANLSVEEIIKATVETVAENLSDGVTAPLMYMFIGGAPLGFAYKAVSTLDSMLGYRNEKYEHFGKFPARLDDAANFIPSRFTALLMLIAVKIVRLDVKNAVRIFLRDRYCHKSPNSAQTESVCAGALGISLGGGNFYNGVYVEKPHIGDNTRTAVTDDIIIVNQLMYAASWLALAAGIAIRLVITYG